MRTNVRDRSKKGFVNFITNPKIIQAFLTGSVFAVINKAVAVASGPLGSYVNLGRSAVSFSLMIFVAWFWYWADRNQDRFTEKVEEVTDEESETKDEEAE